MKKDTSWDSTAEWYNAVIEEKGSYQTEVILPNLLRVMNIKTNQKILDLGCGTGFFSRAFARAGATVTAIDNSSEMIAMAKKQNEKINYLIGNAENLKSISSQSFDAITVIMAIQNMEHIAQVFAECSRILKKEGKLYIVMNHPTFRVPKYSSWEWTEDQNTQFRRVDHYLSEAKQKIQTHPGSAPENYTVSFHRPLQTYFKLLGKSGLAVTRLEEWISHRQGPKGKTFTALETARKEIPLFLFLHAVKIK